MDCEGCGVGFGSPRIVSMVCETDGVGIAHPRLRRAAVIKAEAASSRGLGLISAM